MKDPPNALADGKDEDVATSVSSTAETTRLLGRNPPTSIDSDLETILNRSRRLLYVSHLFNQFSNKTWQFCLVLFLVAFCNYESLVLVSSYGLVSYSFVCVWGSLVGRWVDHGDRLQIAQFFIGFENCAVLLATAFCYLLLSQNTGTNKDPQQNSSYDCASILLLLGIHLLGASASVLDSGFMVAIERDWIVVMSQVASFARVIAMRIMQHGTSRENPKANGSHKQTSP